MSLVNLQVKPVFKTSLLCAFRSFYFEIWPKTIATVSPTPGLMATKDQSSRKGIGKGREYRREEDLYTTNQVAEKLSVSVATVNRLIQSGALESVRIRRCVRVSEQALGDFLQGLGGPDES